MAAEKTRIVLIPAYMPCKKLITLTKQLFERGFQIIVINDGSSSDKLWVFREVEKRGKVLHHSENLGKGAAIKTGLKFIKDNFSQPYVVVTADADCQHSPADIEKVCAKALKLEKTLVLGCRKLGNEAPIRSRSGNTITRIVFRLRTGHKIYDTQTGLRAFDDNLVDFLLRIDGNRYEYEMKVLLYFVKHKLPICEVPINSIYFDKNSASHFDTVKDSFRIYREIVKYSR